MRKAAVGCRWKSGISCPIKNQRSRVAMLEFRNCHSTKSSWPAPATLVWITLMPLGWNTHKPQQHNHSVTRGVCHGWSCPFEDMYAAKVVVQWNFKGSLRGRVGMAPAHRSCGGDVGIELQKQVVILRR